MIANPVTWSEKNLRNASEQRKALWDFVVKWTGNPELVSFAAKLIKKLNVPERDEKALARAIQVFAQEKIKYFRERPERFVSPLRTIAWGIGDCDDKSILISTILRSFRIPVRLKFIRYDAPQPDGTIKKVSHVYPQAKLENKWIALESVHKWLMGDDPENRALAKGLRPEVFYIGDK
jgi:transglutaminase-like putative cysteine protease